MRVTLVSDDPKMNEFLQMNRLVAYLAATASKQAKIAEIRAARDNGLIDDIEAVELALEFCEEG